MRARAPVGRRLEEGTGLVRFAVLARNLISKWVASSESKCTLPNEIKCYSVT